MILKHCVSMILLGVFLAGCESRATDANHKGLTSEFASNDDPRLIYSNIASDSWNEIFSALFTREFQTRVSDDFAEKGPFAEEDQGITVSTRTFSVLENGDRAIEPLYPSFFNIKGVQQALTEPAYSHLTNALVRALAEETSRTVIAKALMQADIWAAHDILFARKTFPKESSQLLGQRREALLSLLSRFLKRLRLSPEEIESLPRTYDLASTFHDLPNVFAHKSGWIEFHTTQLRSHDVAADLRRSARVFLKPEVNFGDQQRLFENLRDQNLLAFVNSVVLVTQNLLLDNSNRVVPTQLTTTVQIRRFIRNAAGDIIDTEIQQFELSRKSLLSNSRDGGLIENGETAAYFLPSACNDFSFASPQFKRRGPTYPVRVRLRQRCEACHGRGARGIFTLSRFMAEKASVGPALEHGHGWAVAAEKRNREDFKALINTIQMDY